MFQIEDHEALLANINPRAEKHGDESVPALDIKFQLSMNNAALDAFDKGLRGAMFRPALSGEQQDMLDPDRLVALRFPRIERHVWDEEFPGYEIAIAGGLGLTEPMVLTDVTLKKFTFRPIEGGSVEITCTAQAHPDSEEVGALYLLQQKDVQLTLTPPSAQQEELQQAA